MQVCKVITAFPFRFSANRFFRARICISGKTVLQECYSQNKKRNGEKETERERREKERERKTEII